MSRWWRRKLRRWRRRLNRRLPVTRQLAVLAVAAVAVFAATHAHKPAAASPPATTTTAAGLGAGTTTAAGSYTPQSWAAALLTAGGWPRTTCNENAMTAWENAEGGNWANTATYNPLNTTYDDNGRWEARGLVTATINGDGVRAYDSWPTGFTATLTVVRNGLYGPILSALTAGNNAQAVADAVAASPWGTGPFTAEC